MESSATALNATELMHLALHATEHDTPDKAISHLKKLLVIEPNNGKAYYLMGALHAEIGMHDQAVEEMQRALELDTELPATALFQLGLLHMTAGRVDEADTVWKGLDHLGDNDALYLFKSGMLHLVKDEFEQCAAALRAGIELNHFNEDLNNDMRRVLQDAENAAGSTTTDQESNGDGQRMLLSIYENDDDSSN